MKAAIPITSLAAKICTVQVPVVLVDTCSVLDVIRAAYRRDVSSFVIPATKALIHAADSANRRIWLVALEQVEKEWTRHYAQEAAELRNKLNEAEAFLRQFHAATKEVAPHLPVAFSPLGPQQIDASLVALAANLLDACEALSQTGALVAQAAGRSLRRDAPAHRGGSIEDCLIIEHYMEFIRTLRASGFTETCIFITSNSKDFGQPGTPHAPLDTEFATVGLEYGKDLSRARTRINQLAGSLVI